MKDFRKITLLLFLMTMTAALNALQVTLEPPRNAPRQNRTVRLTLSSDSKIDRIDFPALSGAEWIRSRVESSQRWINGEVSYARTLFLIPEKTGILSIPAFTVHSGNQSAKTVPLELNVLAVDVQAAENNSKGVDISEAVWGRITLSPARRTIFTGEKIGVQIDLFVRERYAQAIRLEHFPEVTGSGSAVWSAYPIPQQQGKSRFLFTKPVPAMEKNLPCLRYTFTGSFRAMKAETLRLAASFRIGVLQQRQRRSADPFDDFFSFGMDSFFGSSFAPYTVRIPPLPAVEILPLPPVPDGVLNTGLVGSFDLSGKLAAGSLHAGEITEFLLEIKGKTPVDGFLAPELKVPGFRIYPPEIKQAGNTLTARYAMVPLEPGTKDFQLRFGIFDPQKKEYAVSTVRIQAAVVPGPAGNTPAPVISQEIQNAAGVENPRPVKRDRQEDELFYQKSTPGKPVQIPLIKNHLMLILILLIGAPGAALLLEMRFRKRQKTNADPALRRRAELHKETGELIHALKNAPDREYIRTTVLPKLGEAMGLSAGITAQEAAQKCDDAELKRFFMELDAAGFRPGEAESDHSRVPASVCKALIRLLKKVMLWLCMAAALTLHAAEPDFNTAFNCGKYEESLQKYRSVLQSGSALRPDVLFNLGNTEFRLNNLPMARWYLKQAALLNPGDPEIRGNLAVVDAKLMHSAPETSTLNGMLCVLRDYLRPDQYLLIIAILWALFWGIWSFRRRISPTVFWMAAGVLFLLGFFAAAAFFSQLSGPYSRNKVIVTAPEIRLRSLPGVHAGKNEAVIPGGGDAELLPHKAQGFVRIRINGQEGWVAETQVKPQLPGGVF